MRNRGMRSALLRLLDGFLTGLVLTGLGWVLAALAGVSTLDYSGWVFYAGVVVTILATILGAAGKADGEGILGLFGLLPDDSPAGADDDSLPRRIWTDRFVTTRNVWLSTGFTLLAASVALLVLHYRLGS
jgi:hypothetical protein